MCNFISFHFVLAFRIDKNIYKYIVIAVKCTKPASPHISVLLLQSIFLLSNLPEEFIARDTNEWCSIKMWVFRLYRFLIDFAYVLYRHIREPYIWRVLATEKSSHDISMQPQPFETCQYVYFAHIISFLL